MSPGTPFFAKLAMMSSALAKSAEDARYTSQIHSFNQRCPIQSRQSVLGVRSFYVERSNRISSDGHRARKINFHPRNVFGKPLFTVALPTGLRGQTGASSG